MNQKVKVFAAGALLAASSTSVYADLTGGEILEFADGVGSCLLGGTYPDGCLHGLTKVEVGSYFAMDMNGNGNFELTERVPIARAGAGFTLGVAQAIGTIDEGWLFASNTGYHHTSTGTIPDATAGGNVNMNGWTVNWNNGDIDMGQGANATIGCGVDCSDGDTFTLDYEAVVPSGGFTGVAYQLHMEGIVVVPVSSLPPTAVDDAYTVERLSTGNVLDILINDTDPENNIDVASIVIQTPATQGSTTVNTNGTVTYDHTSTDLSTDSFSYTVKDTDANESNVATVTITVQNALPIAVDDIGISLDVGVSSSVDVNVTANDTDPDGTIDVTTITIVTDAASGTTATNNGIVTYTPNEGFIGSDTFTYTVNDNDGATSNEATVSISVSNSSTAVLDPNAFLLFDTGDVQIPSVRPAVGDGSWFSMEVIADAPTYTSLAGFNHIQLNTIQLASSVPLAPNIDQPWTFFGNIGVHQTTTAITIATDDGAGNVTLGFTGWDVSWNAIPTIPLGEGQDNGIATLTCFDDLAAGTPGDCSFGDQFTLDYRAIVPPNDPSGFGNVNYVLHLEGVISPIGASIGPVVAPDTTTIQAMDTVGTTLAVLPGGIADASGNTTGHNLSVDDINNRDPLLNPNNGEQCVGGCIDYIVADVGTDYVDLIFKLTEPLPEGTVYRKLLGGVWRDLDVSTNDQVGSNLPDTAGACTSPNFNVGLRAGDQCIFLRIYDGGPNDADGVKNGTVIDPSGVLLPGSPNVPPSSTSGCSITSHEGAFKDRADWMILAGFVLLLWIIRRRHGRV